MPWWVTGLCWGLFWVPLTAVVVLAWALFADDRLDRWREEVSGELDLDTDREG